MGTASVRPALAYVDTSAWIALLAREPAGPKVARWLARAGRVATSQWTPVEVASALGIKVRRGDIDADTGRRLVEAFDELHASNGVEALHVAAADFGTAAALCERFASGLRAGDALHLAVAHRCACSSFYTLDRDLYRNAALAGLAALPRTI